MSMRAALTEARQYITKQLMEVICDNSICSDEGVPDRETTDPDVEPWILEAEQVLVSIDAALSDDPTDAECTAAFNVLFGKYDSTMSDYDGLFQLIRLALIEASNVEHVG
jgi:hypothetical protein